MQKSENWFCMHYKILRIFKDKKFAIFGDILAYFLNILNTKSIISQKLKIWKLLFHRFQIIAQLFGTKTQLSYFRWEGMGVDGSECCKLFGTGPKHFLSQKSLKWNGKAHKKHTEKSTLWKTKILWSNKTRNLQKLTIYLQQHIHNW